MVLSSFFLRQPARLRYFSRGRRGRRVRAAIASTDFVDVHNQGAGAGVSILSVGGAVAALVKATNSFKPSTSASLRANASRRAAASALSIVKIASLPAVRTVR
jgi:hypothetical protein